MFRVELRDPPPAESLSSVDWMDHLTWTAVGTVEAASIPEAVTAWFVLNQYEGNAYPQADGQFLVHGVGVHRIVPHF